MIQLSDCNKITDKSLFALANGCPHLTTALFGGCVFVCILFVNHSIRRYAKVTDEGVKAITKQCKEIRTIDLGYVLIRSISDQ
jgi:hypothetical protein